MITQNDPQNGTAQKTRPFITAFAIIACGLTGVAVIEVAEVIRNLPVQWHLPFSQSTTGQNNLKQVLNQPPVVQTPVMKP